MKKDVWLARVRTQAGLRNQEVSSFLRAYVFPNAAEANDPDLALCKRAVQLSLEQNLRK